MVDPTITDNTGAYSATELAGHVVGAMNALRSRGIGVGSTVLLVASNHREAVVVYLAAVRLGARIAVMDRRAGEVDRRHALAVTEPQLIVAGADVVAIAQAPAALAEPGPATDEARCEVVVFTSGTSSRPKAVVHTMRSLLAGVRNMAHLLSFAAGDAVFLVSPLASITGLMQLHLALENAGGLILEDAFSPASSLQRLIVHRATVFGGAPFILEELLAEAARQELTSLPLRAVAVGGSAIPRRLLEEASARFGVVPSRVYGSSECPNAFGTVPGDALEQRLADEGVAMAGTEGRLDPATGELQVRGDNLMRGYLDPEHNAEAFTPDGWYRTGDQASLDGGRLRVTGRLKEIVARKGAKISLAEIDGLMHGMPGCITAAAYGIADEHTGERVALAIHTEPGTAITLADVTGWLLTAGLTKHKLPETLVIWHEPLPRTASGKVIRRALADRASSE